VASHPYWGPSPYQAYQTPPPWAYQPPQQKSGSEPWAAALAAIAPIIAERAFEKSPDANTGMMMHFMAMFMNMNAKMMQISAENQGPDLEGYAAIMGALRGGGGLKGLWGGGEPSAPPGSPAPGSKEDLIALVQHLAENEPEKLRAFMAVAAASKGASPKPDSETKADGGAGEA
jgi:hypothetical protein